VRRERVAPLVCDLETWMRKDRAKLSRHSDVAKAIDYMCKRLVLPRFSPYEHGRRDQMHGKVSAYRNSDRR
jgi:hypothetical protein